MKVAELEGMTLDFWWMRATGDLDETVGPDAVMQGEGSLLTWAEVGPVVERERISVFAQLGGWSATISERAKQCGDTALIAAARCFVACKFGEDVPEKVGEQGQTLNDAIETAKAGDVITIVGGVVNIWRGSA